MMTVVPLALVGLALGCVAEDASDVGGPEGVTASALESLRANLTADLLAVKAGLDAKIAALESDAQTLRQTLEQERLAAASERQDLAEALAADDAQQAKVAALLRYIHLDDQDEVVIEGANLRVQNGLGETWGDVNGEVKLIVGYDEHWFVPRCDSGDRMGEHCSYTSDCTGGGTCISVTTSPKTGSHNLVVGFFNEYTGSGSAVLGSEASSNADYAVVLGGYGLLATEDEAVVLPADTIFK